MLLTKTKPSPKSFVSQAAQFASLDTNKLKAVLAKARAANKSSK